MKISKILLITIVASLTGFMACDLNVEPQQSVSHELATGSDTGITAVYHRGYRVQMSEAYWGQRLVIAGDALADNAVSNPSNSGRYTGEPVNSFGSGVGGWNRYLGINDINTVLKYAPEVDGLSDARRTSMIGEMLFLRALSYHDLVKVYGYEPNKIQNGWDLGVIIRKEPTEEVGQASEQLPRSTVHEVYEFIEEDLLQSIEHLSQHDGNGPYFATEAAAHALLARVYLYWEKWSDAIHHATQAIALSPVDVAGPGTIPGMYDLAPNPESIFEFRFTLSESLGINVALSAALTPLSHYDLLPSDEFLATLSEDDVRNELYPYANENYPGEGHDPEIRYVSKYEGSVAPNTDNVPVIRISEVYLTRAEAYAESGNATDALADLNKIRTNRGLSELTSAPANLVEEILLERRRELAFEGHRWQDLKRKGWDIQKPAITGMPTFFYEDNIQFLARIPAAELPLNENLRQNPGY